MKRLPNLKRITINSELELNVWLRKNPSYDDSVILVTHTNKTHKKYVSRSQVNEVLAQYGWKTDSRFNLGSDLLGHVISKETATTSD